MSLGLPGLLVALAVTLVASVYDIRERRIPNWLIICGLAAALTLAAVTGNWPDALFGGGIGLIAMLLPRLAKPGSVGMGDVKLAGVVGASVSIDGTLVVVGLGAVAASLVFAVTNRYARVAPRLDLPFAPFMALGVSGALALGALGTPA